MSLPTIVIVPAACQPPSLYAPFASALQAQSFTVAVIATPSVGASPGLKNNFQDIDAVRKVVTSLLDDGNEVIVLMHSYGGIPGSAALNGLGKVGREKNGEKGGVVRLIYVASWILREGETLPGAGDLKTLRKYASEGLDEEVCVFKLSTIPRSYLVGFSTF